MPNLHHLDTLITEKRRLLSSLSEATRDTASYLNELGVLLELRFEMTGVLEDIDEAVNLGRVTVERNGCQKRIVVSPLQSGTFITMQLVIGKNGLVVSSCPVE